MTLSYVNTLFHIFFDGFGITFGIIAACAVACLLWAWRKWVLGILAVATLSLVVFFGYLAYHNNSPEGRRENAESIRKSIEYTRQLFQK